MKKLQKLLTLAFALSALSCAHAMQQPIPVSFKIQDIKPQQRILAGAGGTIENNSEYLTTDADEPLTYATFEELIRSRANHGLPYILAVVSFKEFKKNDAGKEIAYFRHNYYDANTLNEALFGKIIKSGTKFSYPFDKSQIDPLTRQPIEEVFYFALYPATQTAKLYATSSQLLQGTELEKQNITRQFYLNFLFDQERLSAAPKAANKSNNLQEVITKLKAIHQIK